MRGLVEILKRSGIKQKSRILDAGCGSGFPAIDLVARGYKVVGSDKSSEMVRQIGLNAKQRGLKIEAHYVMWSELENFFGKNKFDFVYCRGNSLVYAASWEQNWIVPERSREEIKLALQNFYQVLKPGGTLYIDLTNKGEKSHTEDIGTIKTIEGPVRLFWEIKRDLKHKVRTWTMYLKFFKTKETKAYPSYSYLLSHDELKDFLKEVGFSKIEANVKVHGEKNYNVFLAKK